MSTPREYDAGAKFQDNPDERSFRNVLRILAPQLVAFFRKRRHWLSLAEELAQKVIPVDLGDVDGQDAIAANYSPGGPAFKFRNWMLLLEPRQRDVMTPRFVEKREYHETLRHTRSPSALWTGVYSTRRSWPHTGITATKWCVGLLARIHTNVRLTASLRLRAEHPYPIRNLGCFQNCPKESLCGLSGLH